MHRRDRAAVLVPLLAVVLVMAGCAGSPASTATSLPSSPPPPSSTSAPSALAFDGDCTSVLGADEAGAILGHAVDSLDRTTPWDVGVIGGVRCQWGADGMPELTVAAYPSAVVPSGILEKDGAECGEGSPCESAAVFGELWVVANASSQPEVDAALDAVGEKASVLPAPAPIASGARWNAPTCDELEPVVAGTLGLEELEDAGMGVDAGLQWRILVETGVSASCEWSGDGENGYADQVAVALAPGTATLPATGTSVNVDGAWAATYVAATAPAWSRVIATTGGDVVEVSGRFHDDSDLVPLAAAVLAFMQVR